MSADFAARALAMRARDKEIPFAQMSSADVHPSANIVQSSGHTNAGIGSALYRHNPDLSAADVAASPLTRFVAADGRVFSLFCPQGICDVTWFGVVPGGATLDMASTPDHTARLQAAVAFALQYRLTLRFPMGTYRTTAPLIAQSYATTRRGLRLQGVWGPGDTTIFYDAADSAVPLFFDNDAIGNVHFEDICFDGSQGTTFWRSYSNGISQRHRFSRVKWSGRWSKIADLVVNPVGGDAGNNNSEYLFDSCETSVSTNQFTLISGNASDQNLNYWIRNCVLWGDITICDMALGGHVHVVDCDVSGWIPDSPQYLFRLTGNSHARGVCSLTVSGLRIEAKDPNCRLLYSRWNQGNISFKNLDMSSQMATTTLSGPSIDIDFGNTPGPIVSFEDSSIMGTVAVNSGTAGHQNGQIVRFARCTMDSVNAASFVALTSTTNAGSKASVSFEDCRYYAASARANDWAGDIGFRGNGIVSPKLRHAIFRLGSGNNPYAGQPVTVTLPVGAIIRRFVCHSHPAGSSANMPVLTFTNGDGNTLATFTSTTQLQQGFIGSVDLTNPTYAHADTTNKATITCTSTANQARAGAIMVEYWA